ncbi:MAG: arylsulfatase A related enzyme [halophilic archaeon J07HX5]|nr:MAG: arylsulfatase A related enzyme [halophilic archaeon J07HX5]
MNTILITVDALRADHLKQYGYHRDTIPTLDRLCESGVVFTHAFANAPYTRVSVPALHTSARLAHTQLASLPTISSELGSTGMTTACLGTRTGFKSAEGDLKFDQYVALGRDEYYRESNSSNRALTQIKDRVMSTVSGLTESHTSIQRLTQIVYDSFPTLAFRYKGYTSAKEVTDKAITWLNQNSHEDFFIWLHYMEGHRPYGVHVDVPEYTTSISNERIRTLMKKAGTTPDTVTTEERELLVDLYDSDLRYFSDQFERLLDTLDELNLRSNSNLIFTSDHGEEFYDHGEYFHRNLPYDTNIQVPLIIDSPAVERSKITSQRELIDIAPTVLNLHDQEPPETFEGIDLFSDTPRKIISTGSQRHPDPTIAVRWKKYKYIYTPRQEYLYNLADDPSESQNLATDRPNIRAEYRRTIPERYFNKNIQANLREPEDEIDRERLEALGYLETKD